MIAVLKTWAEIGECSMSLQEEGGPLHSVPQKNWDLFHIYRLIRENVKPNSCILDVGVAGCPILEGLLARGYSNLYGIDLALKFREKLTRVFLGALRRRDFRIFYGQTPIKLTKGDLCKTGYPDAKFDAITSMSVVEHGIGWDAYFKEMSRVLKPGGYLITSTDYWGQPIKTSHLCAYGVPVKIFAPEDIKEGLSIAVKYGFKKIDSHIPDCGDPCVAWSGVRFTFLMFVLQKL